MYVVQVSLISLISSHTDNIFEHFNAQIPDKDLPYHKKYVFVVPLNTKQRSSIFSHNIPLEHLFLVVEILEILENDDTLYMSCAQLGAASFYLNLIQQIEF